MNDTDNFAVAKSPEGVEALQARDQTRKGRPPDPNRLHFKTVGLRMEDWEYLTLWGPVGSTNGFPHNPTTQIGAVIDYARTMAAEGPGKFGHVVDPEKAKAERTTPAISRYAKRHGMTKAQVTNRAWRAFLKAEQNKVEQESMK